MKINKKVVILSGLIIVSSIYSFIFFKNTQSIYTTGDLSFHLSRIKGLSTIFTSPINYETFNYTGYGVNYFYPFLTFFPAVMLYWMTKNLIVSYIIYVWLLNLCTTLVAYHYGERFLKQKKAAFLFSCLYIFSAYRTVDIYYRSAIAEAIAITLVIPVLFYAYQIISGKEEKYPSVKLALSMSLLVYSHVLSTLMSTALIIIFIFIRLVSKGFKNADFIAIFKKLFSAAGMTLVLTSAFWYPMFEQMLYQKINKPSVTNLYAHASNVFDSLTEAMNNDLTTYSMGLVGLLSLCIPLILFKKLTNIEKKIYYGTCLTWLATTSLVPWYLLQNTPAKLLQFPWRILSLQIIFSSLILTMIFFKNRRYNKTRELFYLFMTVLLLITLTVSSKKNFNQKIISQPGHIVVNKETVEAYTTKGMDYFLYNYSPIASLENKEHIIKHEAKIGSQWVNLPYKTTGSSIIYRVTNEKSQVITLPVYAYLGTNVEINHQPVKEQVNANGLVQISGVKGVADIKVSTSYTVTTIISYLVTLTAYLCLFFKIVFHKR